MWPGGRCRLGGKRCRRLEAGNVGADGFLLLGRLIDPFELGDDDFIGA